LEALLALHAPDDPPEARAEQAHIFVEAAVFDVGVPAGQERHGIHLCESTGGVLGSDLLIAYSRRLSEANEP
jgi:hypothetical protein